MQNLAQFQLPLKFGGRYL